MTVRFSTGFRNSFLGDAFFKGCSGTAELAFVEGGAGVDTITDTQNRFLTAGVKVGDTYTTVGATTDPGNCVGPITVTVVTAGVVTSAAGSFTTSEDFAEATTLTFNNGGDFKTLFASGVIRLYEGSQPATADLAETGTHLVTITKASGAFTGGVATNGLVWGSVISGVVSKNSDVWSGVGLANGTVGWGRLYSNAYTTGASTTAVRIDFAVATSGTALTISDTAIATGATTTVDTATFTMPAA